MGCLSKQKQKYRTFVTEFIVNLIATYCGAVRFEVVHSRSITGSKWKFLFRLEIDAED